jgi:malate dehydrogenase (oxaloacetate-decarboxylating)
VKTAYLTRTSSSTAERSPPGGGAHGRSRASTGIEILEWEDRTFQHARGRQDRGPPLAPVADMDDLAMAYTPGVARGLHGRSRRTPSSRTNTRSASNTVAIVSDGTAVLGPRRHRAARRHAGDGGQGAAVQALRRRRRLPDLPDTKDPDEIVETRAPRSPHLRRHQPRGHRRPGAFDIEERLVEALDIPVFHDDQHGTAIVTVAALENALKIVGKQHGDLKIVVAGVGAAGVAVSEDPHGAGRGQHHRRRPAGAPCTPAARTSTPASSGSPRTPTPRSWPARSPT